jgi:hypothetical protein
VHDARERELLREPDEHEDRGGVRDDRRSHEHVGEAAAPATRPQRVARDDHGCRVDDRGAPLAIRVGPRVRNPTTPCDPQHAVAIGRGVAKS